MRKMDKALHIECAGQGAPLVMLHGWGMHAGLFKPLQEMLCANYQVLAIDLPGHGMSDDFAGFADLAAHADYLMSHIRRVTTARVILLGWSLGGLLAQYIAAHYPQAINRLVLVAATPCFTRHDDWSAGIKSDTLDRFAGELLADYRATLSRFLALQFFGTAEQRELLRYARELVFARPQPRPETLQLGLTLLEQADLREMLGSIECSTLLLNGECDTLVSSTAARYVVEHLPCGRGVLIKGAGHAPFLSHPHIFNQSLLRFLSNE